MNHILFGQHRTGRVGYKKLALESIQPDSDHSEVGTVHMPEQRWAIDPLRTRRVKHELGIDKLNSYRFPVCLMNEQPYRFDVGWGEIRD